MPPSEVSSADASVAVAPAQDRRARLPRSAGWLALWPGLCLTAAIAGLAMGLRQLPVLGSLSPLILAIILGMLFHNLVGTPASAKAGVVFSLRRILRLAIMLLGLQLTVAQLIAVGAGGLAIVATTLFATFLFTVRLARVIGVEKGLAELIAAGTSICGASAVVATNTVTQARDDDVAYAVACVTVFGSLSMLLYPLLQGPLGLDPHSYGLWSGSSIHEIAQVIAAAFQGGKEAGDFGTVAKLARVTMLAPLVLGLGLLARRRHPDGQEGSAAAPVPWFVLGFVAVIGVNSLGLVPVETKSWVIEANGFLLSMALAAMGLETDIRKLARKGLRPLLLGAAAWLFIAGFSLTLIKCLA